MGVRLIHGPRCPPSGLSQFGVLFTFGQEPSAERTLDEVVDCVFVLALVILDLLLEAYGFQWLTRRVSGLHCLSCCASPSSTEHQWRVAWPCHCHCHETNQPGCGIILHAESRSLLAVAIKFMLLNNDDTLLVWEYADTPRSWAIFTFSLT